MQAIALITVAVALVIGSFTDFTRFKVYNLLTFPVFLTGIAYHCLNSGLPGLGFALAGALLGLGVLLIPYLMGGLGAGDVKFVMSLGAWTGPAFLVPAILAGCLAIFAYYMIVVASKQGGIAVWQNINLMLFRLSTFGRNLVMNDQFESVQSAALNHDSPNRGRLIPFSAMMSIGVVLVFVVVWLTGQTTIFQ